jgi:fumarylacetoacetase
VPLGPFLAKKFCIINITLDCYYGCWSLLEFLAKTRSKSTTLFATKGKHSFDIHLEAAIQPENAEPTVK